MKLVPILVVSALALSGAAVAQSLDVEGMAEDLALQVAAGQYCKLPPLARGDAFATRLLALDAGAFERGTVRGVTLLEGLKKKGRKVVCDAARTARPTFEERLTSAAGALDKAARIGALPPAGAPALLTGKALGGDYVTAPEPERAAWLLVAGRLALPEAKPARQAEMGAGIGRCLDEMLSVRKADEAAAVAVMKRTPLAELTTLCAAGLTPR